MYVQDLKSEFCDFLSGKRLYIIVNYDIDGICSFKILQSILKFQNVTYSLEVVQGIKELKSVYDENCKNVKYFLLINCGGTVDLIELLEPDDEVIFFVLDTHKPTDLCNIYSDNQIRLLSNIEDDSDVPEFNDIFRDDESEEEDEEEHVSDEDGNEGKAAKRRRLNEEAIIRRRERRVWEAKRDKLLFEYSQFTYYSRPSAIILYNLSWKLNKDDKDLLWLCIISLTEQFLFEKIENGPYVLEVGNLHEHSIRLKNRTIDTDIATSTKINFENDLKLILYRHWTVESSLKYSLYTACKMRMWTVKGQMRLQELLADMGLPLAQSKQLFGSMDLQLRQEFNDCLQKSAEKYALEDITYATFTLQFGYRNKYAAADIVYALMSILDVSQKGRNPADCFHTALSSLSRSKKDLISSGMEDCKQIITSIYKTVQKAIEMRYIISTGPFVYYIVPESNHDWSTFSQPHILLLLAKYMLNAYVSVSRNRKATSLPLIVSAPKDTERGTCILLGIPPICENSAKNFFGKAFEQAAERLDCDSSCDYFDTSYFEIKVSLRTRLLDALTALLN